MLLLLRSPVPGVGISLGQLVQGAGHGIGHVVGHHLGTHDNLIEGLSTAPGDLVMRRAPPRTANRNREILNTFKSVACSWSYADKISL